MEENFEKIGKSNFLKLTQFKKRASNNLNTQIKLIQILQNT